jgi:cell division transport system ATP-binding protein
MIKFDNVSFEYVKDYRALSDIYLEIKSNELVFITGESGSGKTTLLKLIMGMIKPSYGELIVIDRDMKSINGRELNSLRKEIGPIFQEFRLLKGMNVFENVLLPLRFIKKTGQRNIQIVKDSLDKVGLIHKINDDIESLSWGETQRVAIARAISHKPRLIIADEPTGNLDQNNSVKILNLLESLVDDMTTVIVTTHATHLIDNYKKARIIKMDGGKLYE